jgi:hypothetical protein
MTTGTYASKPLERRICVGSVSKSQGKTMHVIGVMKALTKVCTRALSIQMPAVNCIFLG